MISSIGSTPLTESQDTLSLVAGNVTGGGGKATEQKPNGTVRPLKRLHNKLVKT
jgi:hypothetical protein